MSSILSRLGSVACLALLAMPVLSGTALAQTTAGGADESDDSGIREIVVTAQRRSESILAVPVSIEAMTGDQLNASGVNTITDLQYTSPGFVVADANGFAQIYVRGVGNSIYVGADPSVTTYVDDVPRIYGSMVSAFIDVDRVELLKGAQGGLYGRNATGGVVNIVTRQPSTESIAGSGLLSYGEKNTFRAAGYFNVPLGDTIALSVSAERSSHDGYVRNLATRNPYTAAMFPTGAFLPTGPGGNFVANTPAQTAAAFNAFIDPPQLNDLDLWSINSKLLVRLSDTFKITFAGDYSKKADNQGHQSYQLVPSAPQGLLQFLLSAYGVNAQLPPDFIKASDGKFTAAKSVPSLLYLKDYGASATAVLNAPSVDITSITAYRRHIPRQFDELSQLNVPVVQTNPFRSAWFFYQELRAASTGEGPLQVLGGVTYLKNHYEENIITDIVPPLLMGGLIRSVMNLENWSAYAQAAYELTPDLTLTVSGRYIHEVNRTRFTDPVVSGTELKESKFLPSATLSYRLDGGGNVYARWARGFKGGGINPAVAPSTFAGRTVGSVFKGEQVDTYEIGFRNSLFDRKVQLTAAVFYNDYTNLQVATSGNAAHPEVIFAIVNAGSARSYGAEGSVTWRAAEPLTLGVSAGYLNARYRKFSLLGDPVLLEFDRSGHQMILSPKFQMSLSAVLDQPVSDNLRLVGNVLVSHLSKTLFTESAIPGFLPNAEQPGYWLANLRLGVKTSDERYGFSVFADNLFNKGYTTYGGSSASTGTTEAWGNRRIIGAELTAKF